MADRSILADLTNTTEDKVLFHQGRRLNGIQVSVYSSPTVGIGFLRLAEGAEVVASEDRLPLHSSGLILHEEDSLRRTAAGEWFLHRTCMPVGVGCQEDDLSHEAITRLAQEALVGLTAGEARRWLEEREEYELLAGLFPSKARR